MIINPKIKFSNMNTTRLFIRAFIYLILVSSYSYSQEDSSHPIIKIKDGISVIGDFGCNVAVLTGTDGILIIDTGHKNEADNLDSVIRTLINRPVRYVLNTHFHFDHLGGNNKFAADGAVIIAHNQTRDRMKKEWNVPEIAGVKYPIIPPYPELALPVLGFDDSIKIYMNGENICGYHFPNAHSDCDVVWLLKESNVMHTGDLFLSNGFPIIDIYCGGSIHGYIEAVDEMIRLCDDETAVIPGHGPVSNRQGLIEYRSMLENSRKMIESLIAEGKSVNEIIGSKSIDVLYTKGESWLPSDLFVYVLYEELSGQIINRLAP
jgi:cyclase